MVDAEEYMQVPLPERLKTKANCGGVGQSWHLVFAMALTGIIFLFWIMIMAYQVFADS